jgi:hypothetical protein
MVEIDYEGKRFGITKRHDSAPHGNWVAVEEAEFLLLGDRFYLELVDVAEGLGIEHRHNPDATANEIKSAIRRGELKVWEKD